MKELLNKWYCNKLYIWDLKEMKEYYDIWYYIISFIPNAPWTVGPVGFRLFTWGCQLVEIVGDLVFGNLWLIALLLYCRHDIIGCYLLVAAWFSWNLSCPLFQFTFFPSLRPLQVLSYPNFWPKTLHLYAIWPWSNPDISVKNSTQMVTSLGKIIVYYRIGLGTIA